MVLTNDTSSKIEQIESAAVEVILYSPWCVSVSLTRHVCLLRFPKPNKRIKSSVLVALNVFVV